jgi:chemotaxis protein methyltransferase CheR
MPRLEDRDAVTLLRWAMPRMQLEWTGFRRVRRQVRRRIARRMQALGLEKVEQYRSLLLLRPEEWRVLDRMCRITISRFWRDRRVFECLMEVEMPRLASSAQAAGRSALVAWSAGCACGEEPYSLSIGWAHSAAARRAPLNLHILATDVDSGALRRALRAEYSEPSLRELPGTWRRSALEPAGQRLRVCSKYRESVGFVRHDVRCAPPPRRFDLILCRNLAFTYFSAGLRRRTADTLVDLLVPGGVLVIGSHESVPDGVEGIVPAARSPSAWVRIG